MPTHVINTACSITVSAARTTSDSKFPSKYQTAKRLQPQPQVTTRPTEYAGVEPPNPTLRSSQLDAPQPDRPGLAYFALRSCGTKLGRVVLPHRLHASEAQGGGSKKLAEYLACKSSRAEEVTVGEGFANPDPSCLAYSKPRALRKTAQQHAHTLEPTNQPRSKALRLGLQS